MDVCFCVCAQGFNPIKMAKTIRSIGDDVLLVSEGYGYIFGSKS